jgi:hypothetical protein
MECELKELKLALEHVKEVQEMIMKLNHDAMTLLGDSIFEADVDLCEEGFVALQHQDILTQQLNASSELLEMITKHIDEGDLSNLDKNIASALEVARAKKEAFLGNAFGEKHEDLSELF